MNQDTDPRTEAPDAACAAANCDPVEACVCITLDTGELQAHAARLLGAGVADENLGERRSHAGVFPGNATCCGRKYRRPGLR